MIPWRGHGEPVKWRDQTCIRRVKEAPVDKFHAIAVCAAPRNPTTFETCVSLERPLHVPFALDMFIVCFLKKQLCNLSCVSLECRLHLLFALATFVVCPWSFRRRMLGLGLGLRLRVGLGLGPGLALGLRLTLGLRLHLAQSSPAPST